MKIVHNNHPFIQKVCFLTEKIQKNDFFYGYSVKYTDLIVNTKAKYCDIAQIFVKKRIKKLHFYSQNLK